MYIICDGQLVSEVPIKRPWKRKTNRSDLGLAIDGHYTIFNCVHVEDSGLRVVYHWRPKHRVEDARIADGEVPTGEVVHCQLAIASLKEVS